MDFGGSAGEGLRAAIGAAVGRRRRELGMGQEELADALGVSQAHVSRLERGLTNPTLETLRRLQEVLGVRLLALDPPEATPAGAGELTTKG